MRLRFSALLLAVVVLPWRAASAADGDKEKGAAALGLLKAIDDGFVQVYEKVAPAVVVIDATKRPVDEDEDVPRGFEFFFDDGRPMPRDSDKDGGSRPPHTPGTLSRSEGSGFIVRPRAAERRPGLFRKGHRHRRTDRRRGDQGRGEGPADH
jgi:S1-C subfamily serine protease